MAQSPYQPTPNQSPPPIQQPPARKGLHPLAWVGIGCGGLLVVAIIAVAFLFGAAKRKYDSVVKEFKENPQKVVAEKVVELNPDFEMLSENDEAGEMTIRNKATGEETTISYQDLAEGKLTVKGGDGSVTQLGSADLSSVPAWVPAYPSMTDPVVPYHQDKSGEIQGLLSFSCNDTPADVIAFYEKGMSSSVTSSTSVDVGQLQQASKTFRDGDKKLNVSAQQATGQPTRVQVGYEVKP